MRSLASRTSLLGYVILVFLTGPLAFSDSSTDFDFSQHGIGNLTNTATFTSGSYSITAYGFAAGHQTSDLFFKAGTGDERGLGLVGSKNSHEITDPAFIEFSNLAGKHQQLSLSFGSVQSGESWNIYCSNQLGERGSLLSSGNFEGPINLTQTASDCTFISVSAGFGNVLFSDLRLKAVVSEPATSTLMFTGIAALVLILTGAKVGSKA
ncbi:MAG: hypothetical protein NVS1B11_27010 [Terriglobales bacterium]